MAIDTQAPQKTLRENFDSRQEGNSPPSKRSQKTRGAGKNNKGIQGANTFDQDLARLKNQQKVATLFLLESLVDDEATSFPILVTNVSTYFIRVVPQETSFAGKEMWINKAAILAVMP